MEGVQGCHERLAFVSGVMHIGCAAHYRPLSDALRKGEHGIIVHAGETGYARPIAKAFQHLVERGDRIVVAIKNHDRAKISKIKQRLNTEFVADGTISAGSDEREGCVDIGEHFNLADRLARYVSKGLGVTEFV